MANGAIYCNRCGAQNSSLAKFCANCGTPFAVEPAAPAAALDPLAVVPRPQGPAASLSASLPAAIAVRYGGFWMRFVAFVIDAILVHLVILPLTALLGALIGVAGTAVRMPGVGVHVVSGVAGVALLLLANWIYEAAFESSARQATVGKMALGLKVTDLEGQRISFARATGRHFAKLVSSMILFIGYIMAGFSERKQALHDLIAGTLVMRAA